MSVFASPLHLPLTQKVPRKAKRGRRKRINKASDAVHQLLVSAQRIDACHDIHQPIICPVYDESSNRQVHRSSTQSINRQMDQDRCTQTDRAVGKSYSERTHVSTRKSSAIRPVDQSRSFQRYQDTSSNHTSKMSEYDSSVDFKERSSSTEYARSVSSNPSISNDHHIRRRNRDIIDRKTAMSPEWRPSTPNDSTADFSYSRHAGNHLFVDVNEANSHNHWLQAQPVKQGLLSNWYRRDKPQDITTFNRLTSYFRNVFHPASES